VNLIPLVTSQGVICKLILILNKIIMITKDNLKYAIQTVSPNDIDVAINGSKDYIKFELHTFNVGSFATIEETDYNEEDEENTK